MNGILSSLSGMTSALRRLNVSAHNIANSQTEGYRALRVNSNDVIEKTDFVPEDITLPNDGAEFLPPSNVNLTTEITNQIINANAYKANLNAFKAQDDTLGSLLDIID